MMCQLSGTLPTIQAAAAIGNRANLCILILLLVQDTLCQASSWYRYSNDPMYHQFRTAHSSDVPTHSSTPPEHESAYTFPWPHYAHAIHKRSTSAANDEPMDQARFQILNPWSRIPFNKKRSIGDGHPLSVLQPWMRYPNSKRSTHSNGHPLFGLQPWMRYPNSKRLPSQLLPSMEPWLRFPNNKRGVDESGVAIGENPFMTMQPWMRYPTSKRPAGVGDSGMFPNIDPWQRVPNNRKRSSISSRPARREQLGMIEPWLRFPANKRAVYEAGNLPFPVVEPWNRLPTNRKRSNMAAEHHYGGKDEAMHGQEGVENNNSDQGDFSKNYALIWNDEDAAGHGGRNKRFPIAKSKAGEGVTALNPWLRVPMTNKRDGAESGGNDNAEGKEETVVEEGKSRRKRFPMICFYNSKCMGLPMRYASWHNSPLIRGGRGGAKMMAANEGKQSKVHRAKANRSGGAKAGGESAAIKDWIDNHHDSVDLMLRFGRSSGSHA